MYAHEAQLHAREQFRQLAAAPEDPPLDQMLIWLSIEEQPLEEGSESGEIKTPAVALAQLDALAAGLHLPEGASIFERIARLNHRLFQERGFSGDSEGYDHPRNSILHQVLARRRGLPILLSAVYMEVGRRVGLSILGVGYPGHFLVSPTNAEPRFFVDPFHAGEILTEDRLLNRARQMGFPDPAVTLEPVDHRAILIRVNNNLKGSHLRRENLPGALRAIDRLLALRPTLHGERRDRGLILAHIGRPLEAIRDLEAYLQALPDAPDAWPIQERLQELNRALRGL